MPPPVQGDSTASEDKSMNKDEIEKHQRDTALLLNQLWDSLSQPKCGMHSPSQQARQSGGLSGSSFFNAATSPTSHGHVQGHSADHNRLASKHSGILDAMLNSATGSPQLSPRASDKVRSNILFRGRLFYPVYLLDFMVCCESSMHGAEPYNSIQCVE